MSSVLNSEEGTGEEIEEENIDESTHDEAINDNTQADTAEPALTERGLLESEEEQTVGIDTDVLERKRLATRKPKHGMRTRSWISAMTTV